MKLVDIFENDESDWVQVDETLNMMIDEYIEYSNHHAKAEFNKYIEKFEELVEKRHVTAARSLAKQVGFNVQKKEFSFLTVQPFAISNCPSWASQNLKKLLVDVLDDDDRQKVYDKVGLEIESYLKDHI